MALKELQKAVKNLPVIDKKAEEFILKGEHAIKAVDSNEQKDHRLTLRIPKWLMDKVDYKRKKRVGAISRNLWILEVIENAAKD